MPAMVHWPSLHLSVSQPRLAGREPQRMKWIGAGNGAMNGYAAVIL